MNLAPITIGNDRLVIATIRDPETDEAVDVTDFQSVEFEAWDETGSIRKSLGDGIELASEGRILITVDAADWAPWMPANLGGHLRIEIATLDENGKDNTPVRDVLWTYHPRRNFT